MIFSSMAYIQIGDEFSSYSEFETKLTAYKENKFVDFYIADCRTLASARKRCPNLIEKIPEGVKYYYLKLRCIHGGSYKAPKKSKGVRETSTLKQDCKAYIYLKVDESSCKLTVSKMIEDHNHEVSRALYDHLPNQRRLSPGTRQEVHELLELQANKKMVQEKIFQTTGKLITLRDLSNISITGKNSDRGSLEHIIKDLKTKYSCNVHLMIDSDHKLKGIFIQDLRMRGLYEAYPQFLCADSTYKLLDIRIPVFVLMCEDGNGQSEVVGIGLLVNEDKETLKWFFETFRSENSLPARKTIVIMTDKDLTERCAIKEVFPDSYLRICLFHVLRAFNREVTCQKMGITPSHRDLVKQIFQKLCYCTTSEEYEEVTQQLKDVAEKSVWDYFDSNWNSIKEEWSSITSYNIGSYLNSTNNRVESFNSKLKSVCTHFSSLEKFCSNLFTVLKSLRTERDNVSSKVISKMPTKPFSNAEEEMFFHALTPYAFSKVQEQIKLSENVIVESLTYSVDSITCNCKFMFSMCLPCKHIFSYRRNNGLPIYDEKLCDQRWTRKYFLANLNLLNSGASTMVAEATPSTSRITVDQPKKAQTVLQKYKKVVMVTNKIAAITAEQSNICFEERIKFLESVYQLWSAGKELAVVEIAGDTGVEEPEMLQVCPEVDIEISNHQQKIAEDTGSEESEMLQVHADIETPNHHQKIAEEISLEVYPDMRNHPVDQAVGSEYETGLNNINLLENEDEFVKNIVMPSRVKMRGRPKGATLTVVGLPKKKKKGLVSFEKKTCFEKREILLSWFLDAKTIDKIKKEKYLVEETDIECRPDKITSAALSEKVDINLIRNFFSIDGWNMLQTVIQSKRVNYTLTCPACSRDVEENTAICGACLLTLSGTLPLNVGISTKKFIGCLFRTRIACR